jgi:hypothetical protein
MVAASVNLREVLEANTFTSLTFFSIIFAEIILLCISVNAVMIIIATMAKAAINNDIRAIPMFLNNSLFSVPAHKYIDHFKSKNFQFFFGCIGWLSFELSSLEISNENAVQFHKKYSKRSSQCAIEILDVSLGVQVYSVHFKGLIENF